MRCSPAFKQQLPINALQSIRVWPASANSGGLGPHTNDRKAHRPGSSADFKTYWKTSTATARELVSPKHNSGDLRLFRMRSTRSQVVGGAAAEISRRRASQGTLINVRVSRTSPNLENGLQVDSSRKPQLREDFLGVGPFAGSCTDICAALHPFSGCSAKPGNERGGRQSKMWARMHVLYFV